MTPAEINAANKAKPARVGRITHVGNNLDAVTYERNLELAKGVVAQIQGPARAKLFKALEVSANISDAEKGLAAAQALALMGASMGADYVAITQKARDGELTGAGKKKPNIFRAVQNEIGRGIKNVGKEVQRWTKAPLIGKYFVGPLGGAAVAESMIQVGAVLRGGSIRDFDDRAFVLALGHTFSSTGQALIAASPFLPAPWNAAALAVGTVSVFAGKAMQGHVQQQEQKARVRAARGKEYEAPAQPIQRPTRPARGDVIPAQEPEYEEPAYEEADYEASATSETEPDTEPTAQEEDFYGEG